MPLAIMTTLAPRPRADLYEKDRGGTAAQSHADKNYKEAVAAAVAACAAETYFEPDLATCGNQPVSLVFLRKTASTCVNLHAIERTQL